MAMVVVISNVVAGIIISVSVSILLVVARRASGSTSSTHIYWRGARAVPSIVIIAIAGACTVGNVWRSIRVVTVCA